MEQQIKLKHPKGLYLISFVAIWERFSYYGMRAFLILYMANDILNPANKDSHLGGLGIDRGTAGIIYGIFTGMCYFLSLPGGFIADRYLGKRRSILIGGFLIMFGLFTLALDQGKGLFFTGLTLLAIGNGFFKPSASSMVGDLYEQGDKRKDSAYTIFYTLFNGGAFLAPIIIGLLNEKAYQYGFMTAGFGMMLGLIAYISVGQKYLGDLGKHAIHKQNIKNKVEKIPLTKQEKNRIGVIFIVIFFVTFFWMGFEQAGGTFNLYAKDFINRKICGWEIPTEWFQSINPFLILIFGIPFSALWLYLTKKGKNPSIPVKMGLGMIVLGLGFLFMIGAVLQRGGDNSDTTVKASLIFLVMTYLFHTIGELCVSPIGLSMVSKLAPVRMATLFMGTWFFSIFLANFLAGFMVQFVERFGTMTIFVSIASFVALLGIIILLMSKRLVKMMHGIV
ncbi:MAG: peptide MFS transporter [Bacteroidales bacterium]